MLSALALRRLVVIRGSIWTAPLGCYHSTIVYSYPLSFTKPLVTPSYLPFTVTDRSNVFEFHQPDVLSNQNRFLSVKARKPEPDAPLANEPAIKPPQKLTLLQRFKDAYKVYGKVLIVVHGVTSAAWLGVFYLIAFSGLNVAELLQNLHVPDWVLKPFNAAGGSVGLFASAYILYKVAAPIRYGLTLWLTPIIVHRLRAAGRLPPLAESDRLRNLVREGVTETKIKLRRTRRSWKSKRPVKIFRSK
uniref:DUF1279 domain-containing protein n=1 Tax=Mesocestoides corti TaxID=53468 RepID=A0A5K3FB12_MESCO